MIAITNAGVVLEESVLENGVILVKGDRIAEVGTADSVKIPENSEIIDAGGMYVGPGFVDIHVHGGDGEYFYTDPLKAAKHLLSHGETTQLATLGVKIPKEKYVGCVETVKAVMGKGLAGKAIGGFYLEGPYMNPKYGSDPDKVPWRGEIRREDYMPVLKALGNLVKVWAIAPEREGIAGFMADAKLANPAVGFAVGHSEAVPAEVDAVKKYGIVLQTHCMNATGRPACSGGTRSCGPDEACLMDPNIYAELICDSQGIHVSADMQKFVMFVKGIDKVCLISDSNVNVGDPPPYLAHITDLQFDSLGGLSGSKLTLDAACRNVIKHTGCSVTDAFKMASRNPARAVGLYREVGTVEVGKRADIVIVDGDFNIQKVMICGEFFK